MKIGLLGTRGVPANYGGFETCVEQLGQRLVKRGHKVDVYCRPHHIQYDGSEYKGMRLIKIPTVRSKYLETIIHTFLSSIYALWQGYDIVLYFIAGNSPVSWIPRLTGAKTIINVDGLDWKREKWPAAAKKYLQFAEFLATKLPNVALTDSRVVQKYYQEKYQASIPYIPYGSELKKIKPGNTLATYNLNPGKYFLFVGRLVPENRIEHLVRAFKMLESDFRCVIVGDAPYADEYINMLKKEGEADPRIIFTGYVFGEGYQELCSNAYVFVETSKASGTHPALIEAMALGNCVVVNDIPENMETIGEAGLSYSDQQGSEGLYQILDLLINQAGLVEDYRKKAENRAKEKYSWKSVTDQYEELFQDLLS